MVTEFENISGEESARESDEDEQTSEKSINSEHMGVVGDNNDHLNDDSPA